MLTKRDTHRRLTAHADAYLAKANAWALANRQPGESLMAARKRFAAAQAPADHTPPAQVLAEVKARREAEWAANPLSHDLIDDGEVDALWHLDRTTRRFRVRPLRPTDNWSGEREGMLLLINTSTMEALVVRGDILGRPATDSDDFASSVFALRDWANMSAEGNA